MATALYGPHALCQTRGMKVVGTSRRSDGALVLGGVALHEIVKETPAYVYDLDAMAAEARALDEAFEGAPHRICYAVKANSAGAVVKALAAEGCGADVVSGAELELALKCGIAPDAILYSGVAKTDEEIDLAIGIGIRAIQAESVEELLRISARANALGKRASVSLRLNPGVAADDLHTHSYIATGHDDAKFGIHVDLLPDALQALDGHLSLVGLTAHVGSQFTSTDAYLASARTVFEVARQIAHAHPLVYVDTGGGFGIDYGDGCPVTPADFIRATRGLQRELGMDHLALYCEPGRALVGAHGVLVSRVIQRKIAGQRRWTMIDAGMNDLMRPALYQARHRIVPLIAKGAVHSYKVVGPVCESSDDFGVHELPDTEAVALLDAGAYGYSMASRYNGRALPGEVFLRGGKVVARTSRRARTDWVDDRVAAGSF